MMAHSGIVLSTRCIVQALAGTIVLILMAGCGTLYELEINAGNPGQSELRGSYVLVPGMPGISVDSAEFEKYSGQIERGLAGGELRRLPITRVTDADMAIVVDYWVDDPETVGYSTKVPMFQEKAPMTSEEGTRQRSSSSGSGGSSSGRTSVPDPVPAQELVGTRSYSFARTKYWRNLTLRAISFDLDGSDIPSIHQTASLWTVAVYTFGSSPDLDEVLPVMVAAAKPYVGMHSQEPITEKMNGIDKRIRMIREGR